MSAVEKLLPQNTDAEAALLGALLIDPDALLQVTEVVQPEDFYREAHRTIFAAMRSLSQANGAWDLITVLDDLQRTGRLEDIGGVSYVSSLANQVPSSRNALHYAGLVARTATNRRLIHAAGQIAGVAYNDPEGASAQEQAEQLIFAVGQQTRARGDVVPVSAVLPRWLDDLEAVMSRSESGALTGVDTGLIELNKLTGGLQKSDLLILAARPAVGKSSLALSLASNAARRDFRVLLFSLEMSKQDLATRLIAMEAGVDVQRLRLGRVTDEEMPAISRAVGIVNQRPILVDDTAALSLMGMRGKARKAKLQGGLDLIIVDYLQLMGQSGGEGKERRSANRQEEISELSRGLKLLARELDVPVLALSQLSRAVESRQDKRPQLSDLRESGAIEQDADVVMFIYRDEVYNPETDRPHIADLIIAKHRNGPLGGVSLYFEQHTTRYRSLTRWTTGGQEMSGPIDDDVA